MVKVHLELEGEVDDVIWALAPGQRRGSRRRSESYRSANRRSGTKTGGVSHHYGAGASDRFRRLADWPLDGGGWLATSWQALILWAGGWRTTSGEPVQRASIGVPLCRRTGLTPAELRSLLMRMGHALRRFQRGTGDEVVSTSGGKQPAAELLRRSRVRRGGGVPDVRRGKPLTGSRRWARGRANLASVVGRADDNGLPAWPNFSAPFTPQQLVDLLLANETVSVRVAHVLVSRVVSTHRRDAVSASLRTGDAAIPVVIV